MMQEKLLKGGPDNNKHKQAYLADCADKQHEEGNSILTATANAKRMGFEQLGIDLRDPVLLSKYQETKTETLAKPKYHFSKLQLARLRLNQFTTMPVMFNGLKKQFAQLEANKKVARNRRSLSSTQLFQELRDYAASKWDVHAIGFTAVPKELIFKDNYILYGHALVLIQEMKKEKIRQAPSASTALEVFRVYAELGKASNAIAQWLRDRGIKSQPVHPLGGSLMTPPLAGKAGLGWFGLSGNLITPQFGKRHRISVVLVEDQLFDYTDSDQHKWIENYCANCMACQKACPTQAIYKKGVPYGDIIPGIGRLHQSIDYIKCFAYFEPTGGCGICLKVCPFSQGPQAFARIKQKYT